jgi:hypothetical protein
LASREDNFSNKGDIHTWTIRESIREADNKVVNQVNNKHPAARAMVINRLEAVKAVNREATAICRAARATVVNRPQVVNQGIKIPESMARAKVEVRNAQNEPKT